MPKLFDRVKVNIATTGTGTVTFGTATSNAFLTPTEAGCADGDMVRYIIVDGTDYEEGIGTVASSVATMARTTVTKSKVSGTVGTDKLDLSGTAVLFLTAGAFDIGALRGTRTASGTSDTINNGDLATEILYTNAGSVAVTLPQAGASGLFVDGWCTIVRNANVGTVTITPTTSTINGAASLAIPSNQAVKIVSDGSNYRVYYLPTVAPLLASSNLADLASAAAALTNLGGTTVGKALFTATDAATARTAAGVGTGAAASKTDQQTGTSNTVAVTPLHQQDHDSADKVKGYFTFSGSTYTEAYGFNIASITRNATGDVTVAFTTPFASTNFGVEGFLNQSGGAGVTETIQEVLGNRTTSSVNLVIKGTGSAGVSTDRGFSISAFGRQ